MQPLSQEQIVGGFNRREPIATRLIINKYWPITFGMVDKATDHSHEAGDLTQDVFEKLALHTDPFKTETAIRNYINKTAISVSLNYNKRREMKERKSDFAEKYYDALSEQRNIRFEAYACFGDFFYREIEKLRPKVKNVILLCYQHGLNNSEIAERLGVKEKTVCNLKDMASRKLRIEIEKRGGRSKIYLIILLIIILYAIW
jgi:RNA polymerase sigma factor (sigma-70 family)